MKWLFVVAILFAGSAWGQQSLLDRFDRFIEDTGALSAIAIDAGNACKRHIDDNALHTECARFWLAYKKLREVIVSNMEFIDNNQHFLIARAPIDSMQNFPRVMSMAKEARDMKLYIEQYRELFAE